MESKLKALDAELQLLALTRGKTDTVVEKGNNDKIARHREALRKIVANVEDLKMDIEKGKLEAAESIEDVKAWGASIEKTIDEVDLQVADLTRYLEEIGTKEKTQKLEEEEAILAKKREDELQFEKLKLEQKSKLQSLDQPTAKPPSKGNVKMPKLVITKYDGTYEKWLSFWNKFEAEIDAADIAPVTKFAHLKELLESNVCETIDGLPFNSEGYERAKNILKSNYGKTSEIVRAYIDNINALPVISGSKPNEIHKFWQTLNYNVQALETLGKLSGCLSMVRGVLDKLPGIKADLVNGKPGWQDWGFAELMRSLEEWKAIHPMEVNESVHEISPSQPSHLRSRPPRPPRPPRTPRDNSFYAQDRGPISRRVCVYCDRETHRSWECDSVTSPAERRRILQSKRLCFNCTGTQHNASQCRSRTSCVHCKQKHHSSICDRSTTAGRQTTTSGGVALTATQEGEKVCHPVVLVKLNGVTCRALLDTGATASYASGYILDRLNLVPSRTLTRQIQTIVGTVTKRTETYNVQVSDTKGNYTIPLSANRIDRAELLCVENPNYREMIGKYRHLKGVDIEDTDTKSLLPVHVILGASDYAKIKTSTSQRTGSIGEPVAEFTLFGWTIMSPGTEQNLDSMFLAQTTSTSYEELCRMDVLGLEDKPNGDQSVVYEEFIEQLSRSPEGWYETGLPWKGDHPPLPSNKSGSLKRLGSLVQRLKKTGKLKDYDAIIQEQLHEGVIEEAEMPASGREFYIPHKAVVRESAETTKTRIVYDASARAYESAPSLNDCLEVGPPLQNQLWKVLLRGRFHAVALAGDIRKAFLQVRIREQDRDALRFHWLDGKNPLRIRTYRFTRALFGLGPSPFLLGGVIQHHLNTCRADHPDTVAGIERELYVDDLITGGGTVQETEEKKAKTTEIFRRATFHLHKWHSNIPKLEISEDAGNEDDLSYAKQQLRVKSRECGLLGLKWNKSTDEIAVTIPEEVAQPTKRGILGKVARIYDPLGLIAPITLQGKLLYRNACEEKSAWDAPLSVPLEQLWQKWERSLPHEVSCPRALTSAQESIEKIELHAFGDASAKGVAAAVYAVVKQPSTLNQGLVAAKARLAKQGLTIPRRELVSGHMAVNLLSNVQDALQGFPVISLHCWLDSSVALYWILGGGDYKQFVANRVRKIREHVEVIWRHVPTDDNPADLASRGGLVSKENQLWWSGPEWLSDPRKWPENLVTAPSKESNQEVKTTKELFALAVNSDDELDELLAKSSYWKTLRVCAWIMRFAQNARTKRANRTKGPLTTEEIGKQTLFWLMRAQSQGTANMEEDRLRLNLQRNKDGLLECRGRLPGPYPIYIPDATTFAEKFVQHAHKATLHGGVGLTMAKIREEYWIPRLRRLAKKTIRQCYGCKRFQAVALAAPPPGLLPPERREGSSPFEVVGVDFAGPIKYRKSSRAEGKAYLVLYACSLTRALYLEILPNLETTTFMASLKRFIARRGRPSKIFSDNGRTFVGAAKLLKEIQKDEQMQDYLASEKITWRFNLSRAPWWGGQFERLVGLFKRAFYKVIGGGMLTWSELSEVVLDVETHLNRRPLSYVEDDVQLPLLTPSSFLFQRSISLPERQPWREEDYDLRKREMYLRTCKDALWKRWTREYLAALRERHTHNIPGTPRPLNVGDVVIIRSEDKNRGKWPLGVVEELFEGRDGKVRAVKLRAGRTFLERPIQHLYPLELTCDKVPERAAAPPPLNAGASVFRPRRDAAVAATLRIQGVAEDGEL